MRAMKRKNPKFEVRSGINVNMDFNTCVVDKLEECQFIQDTDPNQFGGHRSLISQFCGHGKVPTSKKKETCRGGEGILRGLRGKSKELPSLRGEIQKRLL